MNQTHLRLLSSSESGCDCTCSFSCRYAAIESELISIIQEDYNFYEYHTSYLERCIKRFEADFDRAVGASHTLSCVSRSWSSSMAVNCRPLQATVLRNALAQYIRHCGTIRRRGLMRVANAGNKLQVCPLERVASKACDLT